MSGIVGSYFNTRGSGIVAKLGTDGQVFTSTGAGLSQGFEAAGAGGLVLQAVGMTKTDTTSYGTASWADISGMTLAITPTKASSKILLNINCSFGGRDLGMAGKVQVDIEGGGYNGHGDYSTISKGMSLLYAPSYNLTDVITFKLQWNGTSSNTIYLNRMYDNTDDANYVRTCSMMTAMEID